LLVSTVDTTVPSQSPATTCSWTPDELGTNFGWSNPNTDDPDASRFAVVGHWVPLHGAIVGIRAKSEPPSI
jgi:hypothetical protein